jgi:K+/H+ antiporter YhaU regulatory subunit KhtT
LDVNTARLTGQDLRQVGIRERFGVTVVSISRKSGEVVANPPASEVLRLGDKLRVFGLPQQINDLAAELSGRK